MPFAQVAADWSWRGPIIRVVRATLSSDELRTFQPGFEATIARFGERWVSNFSLWWGTGEQRGRTRLAIVSGWDDLGHLRRARAGLREARSEEPVDFLDRRASGEIWRMVDQAATTLAPDDATLLRLTRVPVRRDADTAFIDHWTSVRAKLVERGILRVSQLARREGPDGANLLLVNIWRGPVGEGPDAPWHQLFGAGLPPGVLRGDIRAETYSMRQTAVLRLAPGGAALLIVDDGGRIVDATPAASSLLAADVWEVLDRRLEDLLVEAPRTDVPSKLLGPYRFRRPEGGTVLLWARGGKDTPVPGRNAILLAPGSDRAPSREDLDASIAVSYRRRSAFAS